MNAGVLLEFWLASQLMPSEQQEGLLGFRSASKKVLGSEAAKKIKIKSIWSVAASDQTGERVPPTAPLAPVLMDSGARIASDRLTLRFV